MDTLENVENTKWSNSPSVADLKQDLTEAKNAHDAHISEVGTWLDNLNISGSAKFEAKKGYSSVQPKLIRKQAEWRYAALSEPFLSTDDLFDTSPVTWEDKEGAIQNGLILNNQFNTKLNKTQFIDEYIRTAVDEGSVVVRVGWDYEEKEVEVEVPVMAAIPMPMEAPMGLEQPMSGMEVPPNPQMPSIGLPGASMGMQQIQVGTRLEKQIKVVKNQPTVDICDYHNVIIDPTCEGDLDKAQFVIYSFETSLSELKKDGKYKNLSQISVTSSSLLSEPDHEVKDPSSFSFKDKPRQKLVAYEYWGYWDVNGDGIAEPIVATWVGDTMIRLEENPFPNGDLPFVLVQYLPRRKNIYGEPDGSLLEDNQKIIGAVTRGMVDLMGRSANSQIGSRKDALDSVNKRKFERGQDYEFNPNVDPRQAFYMHTFPEIPQSAHLMLQMQHQEAESISGVKSFNTGISGNALGSTATGVRSAMDATSKRELGILRRLAEGVKKIGRKIMAMNAVFLSEEEVVRITNDQFITIRRDDLPGNYDIRLSISTAEADNEKAQELAFMLQTMGNSMPMEMSQMILADIARLRKMPDLAKMIKEYQPQPDPMQQKQMELQIALLEAQVFNEKAKGMENQVDVELKQAKTQTEMAKAKATSSKADLDDLSFIEREKGIDHNRNVDLQQQKIQGDLLKERSKSFNNVSNRG